MNIICLRGVCVTIIVHARNYVHVWCGFHYTAEERWFHVKILLGGGDDESGSGVGLPGNRPGICTKVSQVQGKVVTALRAPYGWPTQEKVTEFVKSMFSLEKVHYSSQQQLADDISQLARNTCEELLAAT